MTISAVSSTMSPMPTVRTPEAKEGPGPDHDGDADNKGSNIASPPAITPSVPSGMGAAVNAKA